MDMYSILNDYREVKECTYKGEQYSVRDNGAVLRHAREGKRIRKDDDTWTFGKPNENTGYMEIGSERVHRIVAFAFLGEPPTPQHIVDHIDTNRRNNRPQNLRWLTKLENALNNPITRKKIEYRSTSAKPLCPKMPAGCVWVSNEWSAWSETKSLAMQRNGWPLPLSGG